MPIFVWCYIAISPVRSPHGIRLILLSAEYPRIYAVQQRFIPDSWRSLSYYIHINVRNDQLYLHARAKTSRTSFPNLTKTKTFFSLLIVIRALFGSY